MTEPNSSTHGPALHFFSPSVYQLECLCPPPGGSTGNGRRCKMETGLWGPCDLWRHASFKVRFIWILPFFSFALGVQYAISTVWLGWVWMRKESGEILLIVQNCRGGGEKKLIFSSFLDPQVFLCFLLCFILFSFWMGGRKFWLNFSGYRQEYGRENWKKKWVSWEWCLEYYIAQ